MSGQSSNLESVLLEIGLPVVCSKAFIDFCRIRHEKPLVLLLSSLAVSNDMHGEWSQRILDLYQSIANQGTLSPGLTALSKRHVLRQTLQWIACKTPCDFGKGVLGSAQDVQIAIELLLDYDQSLAALNLLQLKWGESPIDIHLLDLAKSLLSRQSNNGIQMHCVTQWIHIFEFLHQKMVGPTFDALREQFALIIAENHLAAKHTDQTLQWCQQVENKQDTHKAH
jgi:hypothetical protein